MKAILRLRSRVVLPDGAVVEMVAWELPRETPDRPHALKYRLYCGRDGKCLVRYDNETGKGDHRHYGELEQRYRFRTWETLMEDFLADVDRLTGGKDDKT
ncbi:MAG: hypothetical protein A3H91_12325 [Gammaproteobacteria bacterium RIFCSPLOWO2_02_FULL_61_13]|nr:MAG: hypothetical protein A3H91_12325 [Gammaproteobacteria bacterium RIFCSPLOWO2_02_FULL_61_13]